MNGKMRSYVYIPNILGVQTNIENFRWSYGTDAPISSYDSFKACKIKVILSKVLDKDVCADMTSVKFDTVFHDYSISVKEKVFLYKKCLFSFLNLKYGIRITDDTIYVDVGENYYKFVHYRVMNMHSIGYLLTDLVELMLLTKGYATLYCASVSFCKWNRGIAIFSAPRTGKTLTTLQLCRDYGASFISEDFAVTNGHEIYGAKWTSSYRTYNSIHSNSVRQKRTSIEQMIDTTVVDKAIITDLVILEKGIYNIENNKERYIEKVLSINRYGLNYHKAPITVIVGYFYPDFSPERLLAKEKEILSNIVHKSNCYLISHEVPTMYSNLIFKECIKSD